MNTLITTRGEVFSYDRSKLRYSKELGCNGFHMFEGKADNSTGEVYISMVARDQDAGNPVAVVTYYTGERSINWVLAHDPDTIVYKIKVTSPKNETECRISTNPTRGCQLPLLLDTPTELQATYELGQSFSVPTLPNYEFEVVGLNFLPYASNEGLMLLEHNKLSEKTLNGIVDEKYPDLLPEIRRYIRESTL